MPMWAPATAIVLFTAAACAPLVFGGAVVGHDLYVHLSRVEGFNRALHEGCWYPRWLPDVNAGHGGPTFLFYFPAFYYVTAIVHALRPHVYQATLIAVTLWWAGGLSAMYAFLVRHLGARAALVGTFAYAVLPYRAIQLYQRSALTEMAGLVWIPLLFHSVDALALGAGSGMGFTLALAGLLYTHHGIALMVFAPIIGYAALEIPAGRRQRGAAAALVGIGLAAPSWLPEVLERKYTLMGAPDLKLFRFEYWMSFLFDSRFNLLPDFNAMLEHAALLYAVGAVLALAWLATTRGLPQRAWWGFFVVVAVASLWLQHPSSNFVWQAIPPLQLLDLPWRLQTLNTFAGAVLIGGMAAKQSIWRLAAGALLLASVGLSLTESIAHRRIEPEIASWRHPPRAFGDHVYYQPRWIPVQGFTDAGDAVADGAEVQLVSLNCSRQLYRVRARQDTDLHVPTFYFPGWTATIDAAPATLALRPSDGEISVPVTTGEHLVTLEFRNTWPRTLAALTMIVAGAVLAWLRHSRSHPGA
ncbi:MAG: hypothetical protein HYR72_14365 [Deltaproteobacteria bacterium]|nr:hypothetical protein [Deltaproteobacteria bacterium]